MKGALERCLHFRSDLEHFFLFLVDTTAPVVTCPADITQTVELGTTSVVVDFLDATATDNSGTVTLASRTNSPGSTFSVGDTIVTYTFSDASGNSASCSFRISVVTGRNACLNFLEGQQSLNNFGISIYRPAN